jgi:SAM-dependent methyltransferase
VDDLRAALRAAAAAAAEDVVGQRRHWTGILAAKEDRYGTEPSAPGREAAARFTEAGARDVLELGAGQGRDSLFLARRGFRVTALDFTPSGVEAVARKAVSEGLDDVLRAAVHDCREPLSFPDASFDACYSHMLFCMALTTPELEALSGEVRRVLRPGGLQMYTVRTTDDPDYGAGTSYGDDLYGSGGFVVHFFDRELVERLAAGFDLLEVRESEEGDLPRRLFTVVQRKSGPAPAG